MGTRKKNQRRKASRAVPALQGAADQGAMMTGNDLATFIILPILIVVVIALLLQSDKE